MADNGCILQETAAVVNLPESLYLYLVANHILMNLKDTNEHVNNDLFDLTLPITYLIMKRLQCQNKKMHYRKFLKLHQEMTR